MAVAPGIAADEKAEVVEIVLEGEIQVKAVRKDLSHLFRQEFLCFPKMSSTSREKPDILGNPVKRPSSRPANSLRSFEWASFSIMSADWNFFSRALILPLKDRVSIFTIP